MERSRNVIATAAARTTSTKGVVRLRILLVGPPLTRSSAPKHQCHLSKQGQHIASPPITKSRLGVLPLRLAPLNYTVRSSLYSALTREGSVRFFVAVLCPAW